MQQAIPLEDEFLDIIRKAQRGLGLSDGELCTMARIGETQLKALRRGNYEAGSLQNLAKALGLNPTALSAAAHKSWAPQPVFLDGLAQFNTPYADMHVNAYLVWDPQTLDAAIFDTGADANVMLNFAHSRDLKIHYIFITHRHHDHIADLSKTTARTLAPVWIHKDEAIDGANLFEQGKTFTLGNLKIETHLTAGHATAGISYVIHGLQKPLAIVGDAIFAGSIGGGKVSYRQALQTNQQLIQQLTPETIIAPGHGPLTTVAEEREHNPFLSGF